MAGMDWNLKKLDHIFKFYACKNRQKIVMVNDLFDILLISVTDR